VYLCVAYSIESGPHVTRGVRRAM